MTRRYSGRLGENLLTGPIPSTPTIHPYRGGFVTGVTGVKVPATSFMDFPNIS